MTESRSTTRFEEVVYREQANLRCALRAYLHNSEQHAREAGITPQQYLLLLVTRGHEYYPRVTIGDLADALKLAPSATSLLVDRAVKRSLLQRQEDQSDRRKFLVTLTAQGQDLLDRVTEAHLEETERLEKTLHDILARTTGSK